MPSTIRLDRNQLNSLIENVRANGGDTSELEGLLAEVKAEERRANQGRPRAKSQRPRMEIEEEETLLERLSREVGYLFDDDITDELLEECIAYDRDHTLAELKEECQEAGLSTSGHKKKMAARLISARMRV